MTTTDDIIQTPEQLEDELNSLELVREMREKVDPSDDEHGWYEARKLTSHLIRQVGIQCLSS